MSVTITVRLQEREANALITADGEGRQGWHAKPSQALQSADFKIITAIHNARANAKEIPDDRD